MGNCISVMYYDEIYINRKYQSLSTCDKLTTMYNAMWVMKMDSTKSRFHCIAEAMGYENPKRRFDSYRIKSKEQIV